jgi:hypothetical protein
LLNFVVDAVICLTRLSESSRDPGSTSCIENDVHKTDSLEGTLAALGQTSTEEKIKPGKLTKYIPNAVASASPRRRRPKGIILSG